MWAFQNILHCIASFSVPLFRYRYGASAETFPDLFPSRCESWRDLGTSNIHPTPNLTFCGYKLSLFQIVLNPFSLFRPIGQLLVGDPGAPGNFCRVWGDRHLGKRQWAKSKLHLLLFILGPPCQPEVNPAFFASHNYSREGRIGHASAMLDGHIMLLGGNSSNSKVTGELVSPVNCGNNVTAINCGHCPGYMVEERGSSHVVPWSRSYGGRMPSYSPPPGRRSPAEGCGDDWDWRHPPEKQCPCSGDCEFVSGGSCNRKEGTGNNHLHLKPNLFLLSQKVFSLTWFTMRLVVAQLRELPEMTR